MNQKSNTSERKSEIGKIILIAIAVISFITVVVIFY